MKKISTIILIFALAFASLIIAPGLLNKPFSLLPEMKIADLLDLFTPLILIPLYYLMFYFGSNQIPGLYPSLVFLIFAVLWVEGHSMHLAANSIGHWLSDLMNTDAYQVTHFYDEVMSHIIWHLGVIALSAQLTYRNWRNPYDGKSSNMLVICFAGLVYGLTIFIMGIEGGTVALLYPYSVLAVVVSMIWGWGRFSTMPVLTFFLAGHIIAAVLFTFWRIYWGYFPQFSELGWI